MKFEYRLILSVILMALGFDYVIEGYTAAFIVFEIMAVMITAYKNRLNYRKVVLSAIIVYIIINLITIRIGLFNVLDNLAVHNLLFSVNVVIWYMVFEKYRLNKSVLINRIVIISNFLFLIAIVFTMLVGGEYFLYPAFLSDGGEMAMVVIFAMIFEPIVIINGLLSLKKSEKAFEIKRIKMQNVLK